ELSLRIRGVAVLLPHHPHQPPHRGFTRPLREKRAACMLCRNQSAGLEMLQCLAEQSRENALWRSGHIYPPCSGPLSSERWGSRKGSFRPLSIRHPQARRINVRDTARAKEAAGHHTAYGGDCILYESREEIA